MDFDKQDDPVMIAGCGGLLGCGVGAALLTLLIVALIGLLITSTLGTTAETDVVEAGDAGMLLEGPTGAIAPGDLEFRGMAEHDATVELLINDEVAGSAVADGDGAWVLPLTLSELGDYSAVAVVEDHGEELRSNTLRFSVVSAEDLEHGDDDHGDEETALDLVAPTLSLPTGEIDPTAVALFGTGTPNTRVVVYANGESIGETDVDADGTWALTTSVTRYQTEFEVAGLDTEGVEFERSAAALLLVPAAAAAPTFSAEPTLGSVDFNGEVPRYPLSWSGTGEPGATLEFFADDTSIGTRTVDADGTWTFETETQLAPGEYELTVHELDADGTLLAESESVTLTIPEYDAELEEVAFDGDPQLGDFALDGDLPTAALALSGITLPNLTLNFFADDTPIGSTESDDEGAWTFDGDLSLPAGRYNLFANALDADGNLVATSEPFTVDVPDLSDADTSAEADGSVAIVESTGGAEAYDAVTLTGTADPDSDVALVIDGVDAGTVTAESDGSFSYTGYFSAGDHTAVATVSDGALESEPFEFAVVDAGVPPVLADTDRGAVTVLFTAPDATEVDTAEDGDADAGDGDEDSAETDNADSEALEMLAGSPAVELILDASWSMTLDLTGDNRLTAEDPNSRIAIAKAALADIIANSLTEGSPIAVRAFGNVEGNLSCRTDLMLPLQPVESESLGEVVEGIVPQFDANTALAASLAQVGNDLAETDRPKIVVLLTDGEETCGGDPAAEIEALRDAGIDVRVNIVGFAINDDELKAEFERWAELGGGVYYDAQDADQLATALSNTLTVRYNVLDSDGEIAATGTVGGGPVTLEPGTYSIQLIGSDEVAYENVVITSGGMVELVGQ